MIEKYAMTSPHFEGTVVFGYANGVLTFYDNETDMPEGQLLWCLNNLPNKKTDLEALDGQIKGRIQRVELDTSFEAFWEAYGHKRNRNRCEPQWIKLNDTTRITVMLSLEPYENYLKRKGFAKKLPENYLKYEEYLNDWNKLK